MGVPMPAVVVLIVCKTLPGITDENSNFTKWESRPWAIEGSMMVCRRQEIPMVSVAATQGQEEPPFTREACQQASIMEGVDWDQKHKGSPYRWWRSACPTPVIDQRTKEVVGWVIPDCGHRDTVVCEVDSVI